MLNRTWRSIKAAIGIISIQDTCLNSAVAKQNFYNYFQNKDEILQEITQAIFFDGSIAAFTQALAEHSDTAARLNYTFMQLFAPIKTYQSADAQVIVQLIQNMSSGIRSNGLELARYHQQVREYFNQCWQCDDTRKDWNVDFIADLLVNSSVGIVLSWVDDQNYPAEQRVLMLKQHIESIVLA